MVPTRPLARWNQDRRWGGAAAFAVAGLPVPGRAEYRVAIDDSNNSRATSRARVAKAVLVGGVAVWVLNSVVRWWLAAPLGHDEARYALDARDLLSGGPNRFLYSAGGMTLVPIPGLLIGGSERALRLLPLFLGTGFLFSAWWLARRAFGGIVAAWTVGVLAGARQMATHSSELLSDLPSAGCLLLAIAILIRELEEDAPRYRVIAIAPLFAMAFYLRYGSSVSIIVISIALLIVGHRKIRRRPLPIACSAGVFLLLVAPHVIMSLRTTGSITGLLRLSAAIPAPPEGALAYLANPIAMYGVLLTPLMLLGLVAVRRSACHLFLLLTAIGQVGALSYTTQPEPRYVFMATALLVILGVESVARLSRRLLMRFSSGRERSETTIRAVAFLAVLALWVVTLSNAFRYADVRRAGPTQTLVAAAIISADRGDSVCEVVGRDLTRLEWYSGCRGVHVPTPGWQFRRYQVGDGDKADTPPGMARVAFLPGVVDIIRTE